MATTQKEKMEKSHAAGQQSISQVAKEGTDLAPGVSGGSPAGKLEEMTLKELRQSTARGIPLVRGPGEKRAAFKEAVVGGRAHTEEGKKAGAEFIAAQEAKGAAKKAKKAGRQVLRGKGGTAMFRDAAKSAASSAIAAGEAVKQAAAPKPKAPAPKGETPEQHLKGIEKGIRETTPRVSDAPTGFADTGEELVDQMLAEEATTSPLETEEAFADPSSPLDEPESRDFTDSPVAQLDIDPAPLGSTRRAQSFRRELLARGVRGDELEQVANVLSHLPPQAYEGRNPDAVLDAARDALAANPSYADDILATPITGGTRRAAVRALAADIDMRVPQESV